MCHLANIRLLDRKRHTRTYDDATTPYLISSERQIPPPFPSPLIEMASIPNDGEREREREPSPKQS